MKKKIVSLMLISAMVVSMAGIAGCGNDQTPSAPAADTSAATVEGSAGPEQQMPPQTKVNVDDTLSVEDAIKSEINVSVDNEPLKVTVLEDCYVKSPTSVAMIPNEDGVDQKLSIYVPENATADSPIIFCVNNAGWIMDAYQARPQLADGEAYVSDSDSDRFGAALSRGYVIVSYGARSRGDGPNAEGAYVSHSPATITDTKAVIRYLRANKDQLPAGDPEKIVITGTSGGGALSTVIASSGNSADYYASLAEIGAAGIEKNEDGTYTSTINDDVFATIAYCPINDLREADAAYEYTYQDARQRLVDAGFPAVDASTGESFQDPFSDVYTAEWMMDASAALSAQYGEYVTSLGLKNMNGEVLTGDNLKADMLQFINDSLEKAAAEVGTEQMLADLAGSANYSGQDTTAMYNSTSDDWNDFLTIGDDGVPYLADEAALNDYLYFVARNQTLKVACAFSNKGITEEGLASVSGFNEDSLFGTTEYPYCAYEFYSWEHDGVAGNGCGKDDTGLSWDEYMATEEGQALALEMKMASPIPYLTAEDGDSAAYWYVRHGLRDRDTAFALQTVLYNALKGDASIENLDFSLAWLQPHAGDYDVQEAYAWLDSVLK